MTEELKRELVVNSLDIAVKEIMKNHMYILDGQTYFPSEDGVISLRFICLVSIVSMDRWAVHMR